MNYGELKQAVLNRVIDAPAAVQSEVPTLVNWAIRKMQREYNYLHMTDTHVFTTSKGVVNLGQMPNDFKEMDLSERPSYEDGIGNVVPLAWSGKYNARIAYGIDPELDFGAPQVLVQQGNPTDVPPTILVYPTPDGISYWDDGEYRIHVPYIAYSAQPLSSDDDTNWLTTTAEEALIACATAEAFRINWDEKRAEFWEGRYVALEKQYKDADKRARLGVVREFVPHQGARGPHTQR